MPVDEKLLAALKQRAANTIPREYEYLAQFQQENEQRWLRADENIVGVGLGRDVNRRPAIQFTCMPRELTQQEQEDVGSFSNRDLIPPSVIEIVDKLRQEEAKRIRGLNLPPDVDPESVKRVRYAEPLVTGQFEDLLFRDDNSVGISPDLRDGPSDEIDTKIHDPGLNGEPDASQAKTVDPSVDIAAADFDVDIEEPDFVIARIQSRDLLPSRGIGGSKIIVNAFNNGYGTLGVGCRDDDRHHYILSNMHVLGEKDNNTGVISIGDSEEVSMEPFQANDFTIGETHSGPDVYPKEGDYYPVNYVDAAIARVDSIEFGNREIQWSGYPVGLQDSPSPGDFVQKTGAGSGYTTGEILMVNVTTEVRVLNQTCVFASQIVMTDIAEPGDSGSVVLNAEKQISGLIFAIACDDFAPCFAIANNAGLVQAALNIILDD